MTEINQLDKIVAVMQNQMDNIEEGMGRLEKKFDDFMKKADETYANKWVEDDVALVKKIVITAVVGGLLALIFVTK